MGWLTKRRLVQAAAALAGLLLGGTVAATVWAQQLVADLSSHLIAITTGFTGTEVVLFGTTDGAGDVEIGRASCRERVYSNV